MNKILKLLLFLILTIFPLGQLVRFQLSFFPQSVRFQPIEILVFVFSLVWTINKIFLKKKIILPAFFLTMAIFGGIASLSLIVKIPKLNFNDFLPAIFYLLRLWNFIIFYLSLTDFLKDEKLPVVKYLLWEGVAISFFALFQYVFLPDTRFLFNSGWDEHYFRAIGTFLDPGFTGILLSLAFVILLIQPFRKINIFYGTLLSLAIGLSFSRATYLSLFIGLTFYFLLGKKIKYYFVFIIIFAILLIILPKPGGEGVDLLRNSSIIARFKNYNQAISIIKDNLWFGVGFNAYRSAQRDYGYIAEEDWLLTNAGAGADNSFLFIWATTGIFGLIAFLVFWTKILKKSYFYAKKLIVSRSLFLSVLMITSASFFANILFYPWVFIWLVMILAVFTVDTSDSIPIRSDSEQGPNK